MKFLRNKLGTAGAAVTLLILAGCLLSGTFVSVIVIRDLDFTNRTGFYYYLVDMSDDAVWEEHRDDIKDIEVVGFDLWITNHEGQAHEFNIYVSDRGKAALTTRPEVEDKATVVLDKLKVPADKQTHVTYGQSFKYLKNIDLLRSMAYRGGFHYYGLTKLGTTDGFTIDTLRVIVTFSAGK